ncbi:E3 ubiquitin-protein ligase Topor [Salix suchowensis]|nr:E3 ubiquitin-protein ligase Topor [Salix suchowensis]
MDQQDSDSNNENQSCSSSDSNPCPICLAPFLQESYLDTCFHKFCYKCILQWTKVVSHKESRRPSAVKCPLCKTENFSIIYGYDGSSFQRHYVNQGFEDRYPWLLFNLPFSFLRKYIQPNRWLESWLRREVQALLQEEDTEVILYHILDKKPEMKQEEFEDVVSNAARPFLTAKIDRFVKELELFLASGLNIEAYDDVYLQRMGWNTPKTTEAAGESVEHNPVVPYLYIFDADSEND